MFGKLFHSHHLGVPCDIQDVTSTEIICFTGASQEVFTYYPGTNCKQWCGSSWTHAQPF